VRSEHARRRLPLLVVALLTVAMAPVGIAIRAKGNTPTAARAHAVAKVSPSPTAAMPPVASVDPSTPLPSPAPSGEPSVTPAPSTPTAAPTTPWPTAQPTPRPTSTPAPTHAPLPAPSLTSYPLPAANTGELTYAVGAPDGSLWVADRFQAALWHVYPTQDIVQMPAPAGCNCTADGVSTNIALGPGGTLWVGIRAQGGNNVMAAYLSRVTPDGTQGTYTNFVLPAASDPTVESITAGPDGALWFTQPAAGIVGRITTDGAITQYQVGSAPYAITAGPDGALWFTDRDSSTVHRISTTGAVTAFASPGVSSAAIATGPDGDLWISGSGSLVRMTPAGIATTVPIPAPTTATPASMLVGADGDLWFTDTANYALGEVAADGYVQEFPLTDPYPQYTKFAHNYPGVINLTTGTDGHLWVLTDYFMFPPCIRCSVAGLDELS
jgi:sugar lactone lactonase YvrE